MIDCYSFNLSKQLNISWYLQTLGNVITALSMSWQIFVGMILGALWAKRLQNLKPMKKCSMLKLWISLRMRQPTLQRLALDNQTVERKEFSPWRTYRSKSVKFCWKMIVTRKLAVAPIASDDAPINQQNGYAFASNIEEVPVAGFR